MQSGAGFESEILFEQPGYQELRLSGDEVITRPLFALAGGHRWQRIPPTEKRGRVQSSTVTVAVFELDATRNNRVRESDIQEWVTTAGGPGGQHQNRTLSAVCLRHLPTGIESRCASTRSQHRNRATASAVLEARLSTYYASEQSTVRNAARTKMVGSGQRGDKVRTYRVKDGVVIDHVSNRKIRLRDVLAGRLW